MNKGSSAVLDLYLICSFTGCFILYILLIFDRCEVKLLVLSLELQISSDKGIPSFLTLFNKLIMC